MPRSVAPSRLITMIAMTATAITAMPSMTMPTLMTRTPSPTPTTATAKPSRPKTRPIPALPMICSPQVFLSRPALRLIAVTGPTPSTTSTGMTRKVMMFHAMPPSAATMTPVMPPRSRRSCRTRPTVAALGGMAWNIITFLVIPVLVVEGVGPVTAIKRSAGLLKKTWGEQIIGSAGIGLVFGLLGFAVAVVGVGLGVLVMSVGIVMLGIAVIAVAVIAIMVISLLGATLRGIYSAAVYEYAVGGETGAFDKEMLAEAFRPKRSRRII